MDGLESLRFEDVKQVERHGCQLPLPVVSTMMTAGDWLTAPRGLRHRRRSSSRMASEIPEIASVRTRTFVINGVVFHSKYPTSLSPNGVLRPTEAVTIHA